MSRLVLEQKYIELDESEQAEEKRIEVRASVGTVGVERETIIELFADISQKVYEMSLNSKTENVQELTSDMEIDSIHDKFETGTERKGWFR